MNWFRTSNRGKHLFGGMLELKDKLWGGKPDIVNWCLTIAGVAIGYGLHVISIHILTGGQV